MAHVNKGQSSSGTNARNKSAPQGRVNDALRTQEEERKKHSNKLAGFRQALLERDTDEELINAWVFLSEVTEKYLETGKSLLSAAGVILDVLIEDRKTKDSWSREEAQLAKSIHSKRHQMFNAFIAELRRVDPSDTEAEIRRQYVVDKLVFVLGVELKNEEPPSAADLREERAHLRILRRKSIEVVDEQEQDANPPSPPSRKKKPSPKAKMRKAQEKMKEDAEKYLDSCGNKYKEWWEFPDPAGENKHYVKLGRLEG
ncbi:uncharacterized protein JCM6883_004146 [Sporobolomyces salmoneus]|uniref:uncharacterized protein n=1 Tax=Sporobolomyces salmoneus TaxID=183962 RepID=UPI00316EB503